MWFGTVSGWRSTSANRWNDEVEEVVAGELLDVLRELEPHQEDVADVGGEPLDVLEQVRPDVVRVALELLEVELRDVVEGDARDAVQDRAEVLLLTLPPFIASALARTFALVGSRTQSSRRRTVIGRMTLP